MTIDLHGMNENEAILKLDAFLLNFDESFMTQCKIIVGKGMVLNSLVIDQATKYDYQWKYENNNHGAMIIYR